MGVVWLNFQIDLLLIIERMEFLAWNKKVKTEINKPTDRINRNIRSRSIIVQAKLSHNRSGKNNH